MPEKGQADFGKQPRADLRRERDNALAEVNRLKVLLDAANAELQAAHPPAIPQEPCTARIFHGPGHQSRTTCHKRGPHEVHEAVYGEFNQYAEWHTDTVTSGYFDEPPRTLDD